MHTDTQGDMKLQQCVSVYTHDAKHTVHYYPKIHDSVYSHGKKYNGDVTNKKL